RALPLPAAQDFKRIGDGDEGPNTGGMGSYSPVGGGAERPGAPGHPPGVGELAPRRKPVRGGALRRGMLPADRPRAPPVQLRFGDPETQSLLPRLETDLLDLLAAAAGGRLSDTAVSFGESAAVTVVIAAGDYPQAGDVGTPIDGIADAEATGALVFHAGTALKG